MKKVIPEQNNNMKNYKELEIAKGDSKMYMQLAVLTCGYTKKITT